MKTYTLSIEQSLKHSPEYPERTATRTIGWDVTYRVYPTVEALQHALHTQGKKPTHYTNWIAVK